jgi:hypothetical protein
MPSSAYQWIYADSDQFQAWETAINQWKQMSDSSTIVQAGEAAGRIIQTQLQDLIYGESTVNGADGQDYSDVAERVIVWSDKSNVYVGVPDGDPGLPRAEEMDVGFPALETAFELAGDSAKTAFEQKLQELVF